MPKCPFLSTYLECYAGGFGKASCLEDEYHCSCKFKHERLQPKKPVESSGNSIVQEAQIMPDISSFLSSMPMRKIAVQPFFTHSYTYQPLAELFVVDERNRSALSALFIQKRDPASAVSEFLSSIAPRSVNQKHIYALSDLYTSVRLMDNIRSFMASMDLSEGEQKALGFVRRMHVRPFFSPELLEIGRSLQTS